MKTLKGVIDSLNYAFDGIIDTIKTESNMKIHIIIASLVLISSLFFKLSKLEIIILFVTISLVLITELLNTAVESITDLITNKEYSEYAKKAKDASAAAVLIAAINSIIVAYFIFFNKLNPITYSVLMSIKNAPAHITFISFLLVFFIVIFLKGYLGLGSPLRGGMPSGHAAIAFSLATSITFIAEDILVATLVFLLALLVAQSRVESKIHSSFEVIIGALIGLFITMIMFQLFG